MADIKYYDVILKPVITEKSMNAMGEKKYTFLVHPEANKSQIKEAVEKMFEGTKVKSVTTITLSFKITIFEGRINHTIIFKCITQFLDYGKKFLLWQMQNRGTCPDAFIFTTRIQILK